MHSVSEVQLSNLMDQNKRRTWPTKAMSAPRGPRVFVPVEMHEFSGQCQGSERGALWQQPKRARLKGRVLYWQQLGRQRPPLNEKPD